MSGHVLSRMGSYETSKELNADIPLIFVVEDDTDIARLICHHLNTAGYATRRFAGSATVVDEAKKTPPALFLLDIMIPGSGAPFVARFYPRSASGCGLEPGRICHSAFGGRIRPEAAGKD